MSERESSGIVVRSGRWVLAVATLSALISVPAGSSRAQVQSQPSVAKTASAGVTTSAKVAVVDTATVTQTATTKPAAEPAGPAGQVVPKGQREGIKVHGHWTIEVRNPDGKVVSHREFENSLATNLGGGAPLLAAILGRNVTPGSWQVLLFDNISQANLIVINEANSEAAAACPGFISQSGGAASCSNTLSLAGAQIVGKDLNGNTLTLSGSGTVPQGFPASIGFVETDNSFCAMSDSPTVCFSDPNAISSISSLFTAKLLDGNTTAGAAAGDPNPVPVSVFQTVVVTVVISFQ